jgi:hypothetical protein
MSQYLISPLVSNQLPGFVRDEHSKFITFVEKYYEWAESNNNFLKVSDDLKQAQDLDLSSEMFLQQIKNEFLPYFPEIVKLDRRKLLKLINQFYNSKGTPNSLKFLFRVLFDEEIDVYFPKDDILKASDGKWVLPLALRIETTDNNIFNIENNLITGLQSKSTAFVEKVTRSVDRQLGISYIELYVSNIEKRFLTGETIVSTYTNNSGVDVTVSGTLIGSLSEINIDPNNRGLYYNSYDANTGYQGDPVTIVGGLNPTSSNPVGALATVGETTKGGITDIVVLNGGYGFRKLENFANSSSVQFTGGFENVNFGTEAFARITLLDEGQFRTLNVSNTSIETIYTQPLSNLENNIISTVATLQNINVYPISFVSLVSGGGGYIGKPTTDVLSFYSEESNDVLMASGLNITKGTNFIFDPLQTFTNLFEPGDIAKLYIRNRLEKIVNVTNVTATQIFFDEFFPNDVFGVELYKLLRRNLKQIGSLGRINIVDGGDNYQVGDYLTFTGGSGYGANAQVTSIHTSNNGIKSVTFNETIDYIRGGEGYNSQELSNTFVSVNSANGSNSILQVTEILGDGESLDLSTSRVGAISKLRIQSYGYDYVASPTISLKNGDLVLSNVTTGQVFISNTKIYQGNSNLLPDFSATVDKYDSASKTLRIFDYKGTINAAALIYSDDGLIDAEISSYLFYGDGKAKATASFENGLIRIPGIYINSDGQVSSDKKIQDSKKYHNYSYIINTQNDYIKFKNSLNDIVHPIGTKTFVNRTDNNIEDTIHTIESNSKYEILLTDYYNVNNSNIITTSNATINLSLFVENGDYLIVNNLERQIIGTGNVSVGSNVVVGSNTNFLNDVQIGSYIRFNGNTELVVDVTGDYRVITQNTFGISANDITLYVSDIQVKEVANVTSNTITVTSNFLGNSNNSLVYVEKMNK